MRFKKYIIIFLAGVPLLFFQNCAQDVSFDSKASLGVEKNNDSEDSVDNFEDQENNASAAENEDNESTENDDQDSNDSNGESADETTDTSNDVEDSSNEGSSDSENDNDVNSGDHSEDNTNNGENNSNSNEEGSVGDGTPDNNNNQTEVEFPGCQTYEEITSHVFEVPARTNEGVCYYKKLMSSIDNHASGSFGESRTEGVISRNHNGSGNIAPFEMANVQMQFQMQGQRNVAISGTYNDPSAPMLIDNYFLFEVDTGLSNNMWAYGTADAEPRSGKILVNNNPVNNFFSFASGGTAQVSAIEFTSSLPVLQLMNMRFRALDCGGAAQASDVFIVFY
jgi:hypothetical protein